MSNQEESSGPSLGVGLDSKTIRGIIGTLITLLVASFFTVMWSTYTKVGEMAAFVERGREIEIVRKVELHDAQIKDLQQRYITMGERVTNIPTRNENDAQIQRIEEAINAMNKRIDRLQASIDRLRDEQQN